MEFRTVAVVQARMGSTRMPGKALAPLAGEPVLGHVLTRLGRAQTIERVVVATTDSRLDDPLVDFARERGALVVRGPEDDVLARFRVAFDATHPDVIVRITGDAPLIDPESIDEWVHALVDAEADLVQVLPAGATIHEGIDLMSRRAFERLIDVAADDPVAQEHVSAWFDLHPGEARVALVDANPDHLFRGARLSVDTPADLEFLNAIYRELGARPTEARIEDVVQLLRSEPKLLAINGHVHQKGAAEPTRHTAIRLRDGHGHAGQIETALGLGRSLRERYGFGVTFLVDKDEPQRESLLADHYRLEERPEGSDESTWLGEVVERLAPDALVLDSIADIDGDALASWDVAERVIALLGDAEDAECLALDRRLGPERAAVLLAGAATKTR